MQRGIVASLLGLAVLGFAGQGLLEGASPEELSSQANEAFRVKSYHRAISSAQAYLSQAPKGADASTMRRLIGLSQVALRKYAEGRATLEELTKLEPASLQRPDVASAIAHCDLQLNASIDVVTKSIDRAVKLHANAGEVRPQVDLLFALADYLGRRLHQPIPLVSNLPSGRQLSIGYRLANALATYDRILALDGSTADDRIRALSSKARLVVNNAWNLDRLPEPAWRTAIPIKVGDLKKPFELAIGFLRQIVNNYPRHAQSPGALFEIAQIQEGRQNEYVAALGSYRDLLERYPRSRQAQGAKESIARITDPSIGLQLTGVVPPGEKPTFTWNVRNVATVELTAYPIDLLALAKRGPLDLDSPSLPMPKGEPAARWSLPTGDEGTHQFLRSEQPASIPLTESDAYLIVARGTNPAGKETTARILAIVSRLGMVLKLGQEKGEVFAVDVKTGEPLKGTDVVLRSDPWRHRQNLNLKPVVLERSVPETGLLEVKLPDSRRDRGWMVTAVARRGKDYALAGGNAATWWGWYTSPTMRSYVYTDRPVYRPEQTVRFKQVIRRIKEGVYSTPGNIGVHVKIHDPRGNAVYEKNLRADADGTINGEFTLDVEPPLGPYRFQVTFPDGSPVELGPGATFRVEEYKKPEFEVTVTPAKPYLKLGEPLEATIHGEYYFGGPVPNAKVEYTVTRETSRPYPFWPRPFGWFYNDLHGTRSRFGGGLTDRAMIWYPSRTDLVTRGTLTTDESGNAQLSIDTAPFPQTPDQDVRYKIDAKMVDQSRREIAGSASLNVTHTAFSVSLQPRKRLYQPDDRVRVAIKARSPNGQPVAFDGTASIDFVTRREERDSSGKITQEETVEPIGKQEIHVDKSGDGEFAFDADRKGYYRVTVTTNDPWGGTITGKTYVWVAKGTGELAHLANRDLELILDRDTLTAGETLNVLINSKAGDARVLVTAEADDLYYAASVSLRDGSATLAIPITKAFQPNITLKAALLHEDKVHQAEEQLQVPPVEEFLTVTIKASKKTFQPREEADVEVEVTDHEGKPVSAEFSLGAVDASIFYIQPETRGDIRKFFYGRYRPMRVGTSTSYAIQQNMRGQTRQYGARFARGGANAVGLAQAPMAESMEIADAAPMASKRAMQKKAAGSFAETTVRSEFPDTAYWAADLKTSADGKATARIRFPDSLTTWSLTAIAVNAKTQVGEVRHEVITRKNVIVRLEAPRFFVEKDEVWLSAIAHNYLEVDKEVRVALEAGPELVLTALRAEGIDPRSGPPSASRHLDILVPAGGERRVEFLAKALKPGEVSLLAKALTDTESDAMRKEYPVLEYGAEKLLAESGILFGRPDSPESTTVTLTIPDALREGSQELTIDVTPTIAGVMLESLPYLIEYPYGCTEQTMSRFLPAALTAHTLQELGINLSDLRKMPATDPVIKKRLQQFKKDPVYDPAKLATIVKAGVDRLQSFQHADGGWGWWKNDQSNPYLTAYVVSGLQVARDCDVTLPEAMIDRGVLFLELGLTSGDRVTRYPWQQGEDTSLRAYMLYAMGMAAPATLRDPRIANQLERVYEGRDDLSDYARALLALTLKQAGRDKEAAIVADNIVDRAQRDRQSGLAYWGKPRGYYYWYQGGTESTSFSLRALLAIRPDSPLIPESVSWLLRQRRGTRWFNTKDTALISVAMAQYLQQTGELDPDLELTVAVDGVEQRRLHVTRENLFTFDGKITLAANALGTGEKRITIRRAGRGNCYWTTFATFFTKEEQIEPAGNEIHVRRRYEKLTPREVEKTRRVYNNQKRAWVEETYREVQYDRSPLEEGDRLASGDLIDVNLQIDAKNNFEYLMFTDPKPAGCEPTELVSGWSWGKGLGAHREFRDERVVFFATYLNQGEHTINYRLRAEIPGVFHALPSSAECMYAPSVRGNGASQIIRIVEE
ncbi:hypothetical protein Pan216_09270 [Planctomycetes bacterium Pan216]|uniref:MG2 domain protein n=1 Tax=Kolteria novifilia TaxID=2527975 RepID=A0A518AZF5_9BACT|nr:hypothetical protein Pan216_09270 [Planctomycetes bacterium Pan216]